MEIKNEEIYKCNINNNIKYCNVIYKHIEIAIWCGKVARQCYIAVYVSGVQAGIRFHLQIVEFRTINILVVTNVEFHRARTRISSGSLPIVTSKCVSQITIVKCWTSLNQNITFNCKRAFGLECRTILYNEASGCGRAANIRPVERRFPLFPQQLLRPERHQNQRPL